MKRTYAETPEELAKFVLTFAQDPCPGPVLEGFMQRRRYIDYEAPDRGRPSDRQVQLDRSTHRNIVPEGGID